MASFRGIQLPSSSMLKIPRESIPCCCLIVAYHCIVSKKSRQSIVSSSWSIGKFSSFSLCLSKFLGLACILRYLLTFQAIQSYIGLCLSRKSQHLEALMLSNFSRICQYCCWMLLVFGGSSKQITSEQNTAINH